ncbi:MAG: hypothetical protein NTV86_04800 [Planctomycetota bacterium]|nr:hypothetical protein [Planctomycetota bacterium]
MRKLKRRSIEKTRRMGPMARTGDIQADVWIIYKSVEDDAGRWVAHSLKTDQIAMGDSVLQAYVVMKRVMRAFWESVGEDDTIVYSPAPKEIHDRLRRARPIPNALLVRAEELLARRSERKPSGTIFKVGIRNQTLETVG